MSTRCPVQHSVHALLLSAALATASPMPACANEAHRFDVAATDTIQAIQDFGTQSGVQILASAEQLAGKRLHSVSGSLSTEDGLKTLLKDTGLTHQYVGDRTVALVAVTTADAESKGVWWRFRRAQLEQGAGGDDAARAASQRDSANGDGPILQEVLVTAQKRSERLQDVPVPVAVLDADSLAEKNQLLIRDYAATVPGLNVAQLGFGSQVLSIRGVTTSGFTLPTVGVTIDGIPYGGLLNVADPDPGDLARIEVLRGPQGTLYGANSMGGLLNFVTKDPTMDVYGGHVEAGLGAVKGGDDPGYNVRASANVPVNDTIALRVSGYTRREPGYIDNPVRNVENLNETNAHGARVSALWKPSDIFSLKLSALYDRSKADGSAEVTTGLGDLEQNYLPGIGGYRRTFQAYSVTAKARLGELDFTSLSGYNDDYGPNSFDWTSAFGGEIQQRWGVGGAPFFDFFRFRKFTQEFQVASTSGARFEWLLGAFYAQTRLRGYEVLAAENPATGAVLGPDWTLDYPRTYEELAAFANLTVHFTDRFDVQFGGRQSRNEEEQETFIQSGPRIGATPLVADPVHSRSDTFTYLVTPRLKVSSDLMVYLRFASGYRPGGPNTADARLPAQYGPDQTRNYEAGLKGDFLAHALSIDASVYYIDWKNIQLQRFLEGANLSFTSNGSSAKSEGVELSVTARPLDSLTISGWVAYNNAVLTESLPNPGPLFGQPGDRLPLSSKVSGSLSIDKRLPLWGTTTGFVGATASYVDDRLSVFVGTPDRQQLPSYTQTDLRAGIDFVPWSARLFVNNVTDERGLVNGGIGYIVPSGFLYTQPRTIGLSVSREF